MLYFYAFYVVFSAIVLAVLHRRSWKEFLLGFVIVSLVPGIGWFFASVWPKRKVQNDDEWFGRYMEQLDDDILTKEKDVPEKVNKPKELDVIPIEEALLVNDHFTRRRIMIDVLKDDATQYIDVVKVAVENEDTETSHYAVSAIMEVKRKSAQTIRQLSEELARRPDDIGLACAYRDALKQSMDSGFMDENTLSVYRDRYIEVLETIISNDDGDIGNEYEEKMLSEIEGANFTEAEQDRSCLFKSIPGPGRTLFAA